MSKEAWIQDDSSVKVWLIDEHDLPLITEANEAINIASTSDNPRDYYCSFGQKKYNYLFLCYVLNLCNQRNISYEFSTKEEQIRFASGGKIRILHRCCGLFRGLNGHFLVDGSISDCMFKSLMAAVVLGNGKIRILEREMKKRYSCFSIHREVETTN